METCLSQTRVTTKVSMDALSGQLADKTRELNTAQLEAERLRSSLAALETRLENNDTTNQTRVCVSPKN